MKILPYHAILEAPGKSGGTVVRGARSFLLNEDQFCFFTRYRWFMMTPSRQALVHHDVTAWFDRHGFLEEIQSSKEAAPFSATEVIRRATLTWRPLLDCHDIYRLARSDKSTAILCLIERALFAYHAPKIIELAARHTRDADLQTTLTNYASEESRHHIDLAKALSLDPDTLTTHEPTDGFNALAFALEALALQRPVSLLVCMSLFETWREPKDGDVFAAEVTTLTGVDVRAFLSHAEIDFDGKHGKKWEAYLIECTPEDCNSLVLDLHRIKHLVDAWNTSIVKDASKIAVALASAGVKGAVPLNVFLQRRPDSNDFR